MPSHADAPNLEHHCAKLVQDCAKLGAELMCWIYCVLCSKILHWPFLSAQKISWPIFSSFPNFVDLFSLFGYFLNLFGLVSPVLCAKIPSCANNSAAIMHQAGASYDMWDPLPPEFLGAIMLLCQTYLVKHAFFPVWGRGSLGDVEEMERAVAVTGNSKGGLFGK